MGQLRDRMDADLRLRGLSENTRRLYLRCARDFAAYCGRSPAAVGTEQVRAFLAGSGEMRFSGQRRDEVYAWTERTLVRYQYAGLRRQEKGLLRR